MRLVTLQSDLSNDPQVADWLFESAAFSEASDPLNILLQREQEEEEDEMISFARTYN